MKDFEGAEEAGDDAEDGDEDSGALVATEGLLDLFAEKREGSRACASDQQNVP